MAGYRNKLFMVLALAVFAILAAVVALPFLTESTPLTTPVSTPAADKDGTLDLAEVQAAAGAAFDKLDKNNAGKLTVAEVVGVMSPDGFNNADADKDGSLNKQEYVGLAMVLFKAADADKDGTLTTPELSSVFGLALKQVLLTK